MWDVVWTDGKRESRKEHRERKAMKRTQGDKRSTTANSILSQSSTSSDGPNTPGLLMLKSVEKSKSLASLSPTFSSIHTSPTVASFDMEIDRASTSSASHEATTESARGSVNTAHKYTLHPDQYSKRSQDSTDPSTGDNHDPAYTHKSHGIPRIISLPWDNDLEERIALEPCQFIQVLSEGSFIVRSTKVTTALRTPSDAIFGLNSSVTISASSDTRPRSSDTQSHTSLRTPSSRLPRRPTPILITPRRVASSNELSTPSTTEGWKPPSVWDCTPTTESFPPAVTNATREPEQGMIPEELDEEQHETNELPTEFSRACLFRLQEEWTPPNHPSSRKSLGAEQTQWMLSALDNMQPEGIAYPGQTSTGGMAEGTTRRILALHDTSATASHLAAVNSSKQVYHLTSTPHSFILSPNIQQVLVSGVTTSSLPVAPSFFEAAHSLRLPLLTTSPEIPGLLQNVHRCLEPGGALRLILVDPLPLASSLGPRLRSWIECHLLLNLETSFRCMNPTKLFPIWLKNALFRVEPEHRTVVELSAASIAEDQLSDVEIRHLSEEATKLRLQSLVGWMLWIEIWGEHITADSWWWEDEEIIEECRRLETGWQCVLINAYKD